jgi:hypothetical protein
VAACGGGNSAQTHPFLSPTKSHPADDTRLAKVMLQRERLKLCNNPLDPFISIIRLWGVLVDYKPKRQRRWSKALVRHGADAPLAIAAALGVPAEDIALSDSRE